MGKIKALKYQLLMDKYKIVMKKLKLASIGSWLFFVVCFSVLMYVGKTKAAYMLLP